MGPSPPARARPAGAPPPPCNCLRCDCVCTGAALRRPTSAGRQQSTQHACWPASHYCAVHKPLGAMCAGQGETMPPSGADGCGRGGHRGRPNAGDAWGGRLASNRCRCSRHDAQVCGPGLEAYSAQLLHFCRSAHDHHMKASMARQRRGSGVVRLLQARPFLDPGMRSRPMCQGQPAISPSVLTHKWSSNSVDLHIGARSRYVVLALNAQSVWVGRAARAASALPRLPAGAPSSLHILSRWLRGSRWGHTSGKALLRAGCSPPQWVLTFDCLYILARAAVCGACLGIII